MFICLTFIPGNVFNLRRDDARLNLEFLKVPIPPLITVHIHTCISSKCIAAESKTNSYKQCIEI